MLVGDLHKFILAGVRFFFSCFPFAPLHTSRGFPGFSLVHFFSNLLCCKVVGKNALWILKCSICRVAISECTSQTKDHKMLLMFLLVVAGPEHVISHYTSLCSGKGGPEVRENRVMAKGPIISGGTAMCINSHLLCFLWEWLCFMWKRCALLF